MILSSIDDYYAKLASGLSDEELTVLLQANERALALAVRTRKDLAQHRLYCLQCELRRRAEARDQRNPGRA